jgi:hypothetical protein
MGAINPLICSNQGQRWIRCRKLARWTAIWIFSQSAAAWLALVLGAAIGWLLARSRFTRTIAELNTSLVLERRVNKQLSEAIQFDAVPSWSQAPGPTMSDEPMHEPTALSG